MTNVEQFDQCPVLRDLAPDARLALAAAARPVEFRRSQRIASWWNPSQGVLVLIEGLAKLVGQSAGAGERILRIYRPVDLVGLRALMDTPQEPYEIVALRSIRGLYLGRREILRATSAHPSIILAIAQEYSRRLAAATDRLMSLMTVEVPVRLSQVLLEFAHANGESPEEYVPLDGCLTHDMLAQLIGASRPYTSVVISDLEEQGAVRRVSRYSMMVRPARLKEIVAEAGSV